MIISNVSWAAYRHIRMISEGSCDTEDWRNDEKIRDKWHFKNTNDKKQIKCHNSTVFTILNQINTVV